MEVNQVEFGGLKVVNNICSTLLVTERCAQKSLFRQFKCDPSVTIRFFRLQSDSVSHSSILLVTVRLAGCNSPIALSKQGEKGWACDERPFGEQIFIFHEHQYLVPHA